MTNLISHTIKRLALVTACLCMTSPQPLRAQQGDTNANYQPVRFVDKVTFAYMAWQPESGTHRQQAQWNLNNVAKWQTFAKTLKDLPETGSNTKSSRAGQPKPPERDYIRIRVITTNDFVARKIHITSEKIRIISQQPKTVYYKPEPSYLKRLKQKQQNYDAFPDKLKHTDMTSMDDGIIVRYMRFVHMPNPVWRISEPKAQNRLFDMLSSLQTIPEYNIDYARNEPRKARTARIVFKNIATPGNFENITLTPDYVRGKKIKIRTHHLKDKADYFAFFKKRARNYME